MKLRQGLAYYAEMDEIFTGKVATGKYTLSSASLAKRDRRDDISVSDDENNSEYFSDDPKTDGKNVKKVARRNEKESPHERILFALSKLTDGIAFPRPEAPRLGLFLHQQIFQVRALYRVEKLYHLSVCSMQIECVHTDLLSRFFLQLS